MNRHLLLISTLLLLAFPSFAQTWEKINTGFNYILMGIEFPGGQSQTGFAGGESLTYMGDGIVIKTTDGGTTWSQLWTGTDQGIEGISFPDLNTGYVCGWSSYFAKTTNGGVNWTTQTPGSDIYYYTDVDFKDATHGVVTAQTNTGFGVYATTDGGATWSTGSGLAGVPYGLCYVTADTYYIVTINGYIQRSTDGGLNWTTVYSGAGLLTGIDFFNPSVGMAAGEDGKLFKTYDGGSTWQSQTIASGYPLWHDFGWYDENTVYVCGTPEMIYKSTNGGSTWADDYIQSTYDPLCTKSCLPTTGQDISAVRKDGSTGLPLYSRHHLQPTIHRSAKEEAFTLPISRQARPQDGTGRLKAAPLQPQHYKTPQ